MARRTITRNAHVVKTFHLEIGCAGMASITGSCRLNVINRLRRSAYPCANRVATRAILGGIFEDAINVTLFASQGEVNVFQDKSGLGMVKRARKRGRTGSGLSLHRKTKQKAQQHGRCDFDDAVVFNDRLHMSHPAFKIYMHSPMPGVKNQLQSNPILI